MNPDDRKAPWSYLTVTWVQVFGDGGLVNAGWLEDRDALERAVKRDGTIACLTELCFN